MSRNVLFICTGNSCRSIIAEAILRHRGQGTYAAFSAGSNPQGNVSPHAVAALARHSYPTDDLRSKGWHEFSGAAAPLMRIVITLCGNAAQKPQPYWRGAPVLAHWGIADPFLAKGPAEDIARHYELALSFMEERIAAFLSLEQKNVPNPEFHAALQRIGQLRGAA